MSIWSHVILYNIFYSHLSYLSHHSHLISFDFISLIQSHFISSISSNFICPIQSLTFLICLISSYLFNFYSSYFISQIFILIHLRILNLSIIIMNVRIMRKIIIYKENKKDYKIIKIKMEEFLKHYLIFIKILSKSLKSKVNFSSYVGQISNFIIFVKNCI